MGMSLRVAKVHKIEFADAKVHGYVECDDFIERLNDYVIVLGSNVHENGYGEGHMEHEVEKIYLEEILTKDYEWAHDFIEYLTEEKFNADKEVIQYLLNESDPDESYAYIYCF